MKGSIEMSDPNDPGGRGLMRPCLGCGSPTTRPRCESCDPTTNGTRYDYRWQKLSARARRRQRFCLDCGSTEDLTTDHSPVAWERKAAGLPVRLEDVAVVCRSCNSKRGRARGSPAI